MKTLKVVKRQLGTLFGCLLITLSSVIALNNASSSQLKSLKLASSLNGSNSLVSLFLGYGDVYNSTTNTPSIWPASLSQPASFLGSNLYANSNDVLSGSLNTGAIIIENNTNETETVSNLNVTIGSTSYPTGGGSWASQSIQPGDAMMADQTSSTSNFVTTSSDSSCTTQNTIVPSITFTLTIGSTSLNETYYDGGLVLTDSGIDRNLSACSEDQAENWTPIGQEASSSLIGGTPAPTEIAGSCSAPETVCNVDSQDISNTLNTQNSDVSINYSGFSSPSLGTPLQLNLTYDKAVAQDQGANSTYPGPFGYGWNNSMDYLLALKNTPFSYSTSTSTGTQAVGINPSGSETGFTAASSGGQCVAPNSLATLGNVPDSNPVDPLATFCAYPRVTEFLSYYSAFGAYLIGANGGENTTSYSYTGQLGYFGTQNDANYVHVSYNVSPGTGDCPSSTTYTWLISCNVYTDAGGRQMAVGINGYGFSLGVWDTNGNQSGNEYLINFDSKQNLSSVADPTSRTTTYTYDTGNSNTSYQHDLLTDTPPIGYGSNTCGTKSTPTYTTCYTYDSTGNVTSITDGLGNTTSYNYQGALSGDGGSVTTITDPNGNVSSDFYDYGLLASKYSGVGTSNMTMENINYNETTGLPTLKLGQNGNYSTSEYDSKGNLCASSAGNSSSSLSSTPPPTCSSNLELPQSSSLVVNSYNGNNENIASLSPQGNLTSTLYDSKGNPIGSQSNVSLLGQSSLVCPSTTTCYSTTKNVSTSGDAITLWTYSSSWTYSLLSTPPNVVSLSSISCPSTTTCYATGSVGSNAPVILTTTNSGSSWNEAQIPSGSISSLSSISCSTTTNCVAVGVAYGSLDPADLYTLDGATWLSQDLSGIANLNSLNWVSCPTTSMCIAVGSDSSGNSAIISGSYPSGGPWSFLSQISNIPNITEQEPLNSVTCSSTTDCIAVGVTTPSYNSVGVILTTTNSGSTWIFQTPPSNTGALNSISCPTTSTCYAGGSETSSQYNSSLIATTNGGSSWSSENVPGSPSFASSKSMITGVSCPSTSTCLTSGISSSASAEMLSTANSGSTWNALFTLIGISTITYYNNGCYPVAGTTNCLNGDMVGEVSSTTDPNGNTTTLTENAEGNVTSATDSSGNKSTFAYDNFGNILEAATPLANLPGATWQNYTTFSAYNEDSQLCWQASDEPSGYAPGGCSSPPSNATLYTYDLNGNTTNVQSPTSTYTTSAYNEDNELCWSAPVNISNPTCSNAPSSATTYTYDSNGNRTKVTDPDGNVTTWGYSDPNCPTSPTSRVLPIYSSGSQDSYTYGNTCDLLSHSQPSPNSTGVQVTTYGHDFLNRPVGTLPNDPGGSASITSIACSSSSTCITVGEDVNNSNQSLTTTNSGSSFTIGTGLSGSSVTSISCPTASTCFVAGINSSDNPQIWSTTNSGSSYSALTMPSGVTSLTSISCSSTTNCVALGTGTSLTDPGVLFTTNGTSFSFQDQSGVAQLGSLTSIDCTSTTSCVAGGGDTSKNADIVTFAWSNSNNNWQGTSQLSYILNRSTENPVSSISCPSSTTCYATGTTTNNKGYIIQSANVGGGTNWTYDTVPNDVVSISSITCPTTSTCYATATSNNYSVPEVISTTNSGSTWSENSIPLNTDLSTDSPDPATSDSLDSISCISTSTCYVAGSSDAGSGNLLETTNSGSTFQIVPAFKPETAAYDLNSNPTTSVDYSGTSTATYNSLNQVVSATDSNNKTTSYTYDLNGNITCIAYPMPNGPSSCLNPPSTSNWTLSYSYNTDNQLVSMTDWLGGTTSYTRNQNGQVTSISYPTTQPMTVSLSYDPTGAITNESISNDPDNDGDSLTDTDSDSDGTHTIATPRNQSEQISSTQLNSGTIQNATYNGANQLLSGGIQNASGTDASYSYSSSGGEISCITAPNSSNASCSNPNSTYSTSLYYNVAGGKGPEVGCSLPTGSSTSFCTIPWISGESTYSYSNNGERVGQTTFSSSSSAFTSYSYDSSSNLNCITEPNSSNVTCSNPNSTYSQELTYNGNGEMMTVNQIGSTSQDITWNNLSSVPRIIEDGSNCYLYGPNIFGYGQDLTEQISSSTNTPSYVISDYAGVAALTSTNGSIKSIYSYTPYGVKSGGGTISTPFGFQGGYDLTTGLVSFIHRVYDPNTAQFLSVDPLYDETLQAYSFAGSDPMNESDAGGMDISCSTKGMNNEGSSGVWPQISYFGLNWGNTYTSACFQATNSSNLPPPLETSGSWEAFVTAMDQLVYNEVTATLKADGYVHQQGIAFQVLTRNSCIINAKGSTGGCLFSVVSVSIMVYINIQANWGDCHSFGLIHCGINYVSVGEYWQTCFIEDCTTYFDGSMSDPPADQRTQFDSWAVAVGSWRFG